MKIGCVIVTYNSEPDISECITSVKAQEIPCEIFVLDNASTDGTRLLLERMQGIHTHYCTRNTGFAAGINTGTAYLIGLGCTHILWLNPDAVLAPGALKRLIAGCERHACHIVQPAIYLPDRKHINTLGNDCLVFGVSYCTDFGRDITEVLRGDRQIFFPSGACMLIKSELFERIGMLDNTFFLYLEDTDFAWRAFKSGYNAYLIADAECYHAYDFCLHSQKLYWLESNRVLMMAKNYTLWSLVLLLPLLIYLELALIIRSILGGYIHWKLLAYGRALFFLPAALLARGKVHRRFVRTDKELFPVFASEITPAYLRSWSIDVFVNPALKSYMNALRKI